MRGCFIILAAAAALPACGSDFAYGTRGPCASGGAINECPDFPHTPEGACEKLVACDLIVRDDPEPFALDWGECVNYIYSLGNDGTMDFTIACVLATSCDQLAISYRAGYCGEFGPNP